MSSKLPASATAGERHSFGGQSRHGVALVHYRSPPAEWGVIPENLHHNPHESRRQDRSGRVPSTVTSRGDVGAVHARQGWGGPSSSNPRGNVLTRSLHAGYLRVRGVLWRRDLRLSGSRLLRID